MGAPALRERVERYLDELGIAHAADADGDLVVTHGNAVTCLVPYEHEGFALVRIFARTNEVALSDELARYLLSQNSRLEIGGFSWEAPGWVAFSYTLLGEFLQRRELEASVSAVASSADHYNDEIKARFGGRLFGEA
jgi:hypothetical protein